MFNLKELQRIRTRAEFAASFEGIPQQWHDAYLTLAIAAERLEKLQQNHREKYSIANRRNGETWQSNHFQ
jgi:hypothetical protein